MKKFYSKLLLALSAAILTLSLSACGLIPNPFEDEDDKNDNQTEIIDTPKDYSNVEVWVAGSSIQKLNKYAKYYTFSYTIKFSGISAYEVEELGATTMPAQYSTQNTQATISGHPSMGYISCYYREMNHTMVTIGPYLKLKDGKTIKGKVVTARYK